MIPRITKENFVKGTNGRLSNWEFCLVLLMAFCVIIWTGYSNYTPPTPSIPCDMPPHTTL
jgi:hypothetical protein